METGDDRIQSKESNIVTNIIKGIYIYVKEGKLYER